MTEALFKILTGVHAGAEIELSEGTWIFGRDDSADIILTDKEIAPRHAAFILSPEGSVRFETLDGAVLTAAGETPSGDTLTAGTLWRLGGVLFAWGPADADRAFWDGVTAAFTGLNAPAPKRAPEAQAAPEENAGDAPEANDAPAEEKPDETPADSPAKPEETARAGSRAGVLCAVAAALLLVFAAAGTATFLVKEDARLAAETWLQDRSPRSAALFGKILSAERGEAFRGWLGTLGVATKPTGPDPETLSASLREAGFKNVAARRAETGAYLFAGSVTNDAERARLLDFAKETRVPVVLDITVESDWTEAYRAALNNVGFWPAVAFKRTGDDKNITVSAYMISSIAEEKAFGDIASVVPSGSAGEGGLTVTRHIRYRDDVEKLVERTLKEKGVSGVRVEYRPGDILFHTTLTPEQKTKVDGVLTALAGQSDVPLKISVMNEAAKLSPAALAKAKAPEKKAQPAKSSGPAFRVTGVSGGSIRFITLSNGEKVFTGGRLPGGYVLESIGHDKLILSKNKKRIQYPLKKVNK